MAASHSSRADSPQAGQMRDYFDQVLKFSPDIPDNPVNTVALPSHRINHDRSEGTSLRSSTFRGFPRSPDQVPPYHDYSASPILTPVPLPEPRKTYASGRAEEISDLDLQGRQTTDDTLLSEKSSNWSKTRIGSPKINLPRSPWRHSVAKGGLPPASRTVREFRSRRQRRRLFAKSAFQWLVTCFLCGCLAACLGGFQSLAWMSLKQKHGFNALIVGLSLFLGNNLSSSLREYAQMLQWRLMAAKYRPLKEFELIMQCDSQRKVLKLMWIARTRGGWRPNKTQWLCASWISVNMLLQVLVALLGLTYNLNTSLTPQQDYGQISVCDLSVIRDIWSEPNPSYFAQLGSANAYGIQGQDYYFTNITATGVAGLNSPTVFANNDAWTTMEYRFQDQNVYDPALTILTTRTINTTATCTKHKVIAGGLGYNTEVTYLDSNDVPVSMDVAHVGPGAVTYIGVLNSTCGPRCTEVMALQSSGTNISEPTFFKCQNTITPVLGIGPYVQPGQSAELYQMPDLQARIMAGAIGWTGFNYTTGDTYEYVRYGLDSWWSPNEIADIGMISRRVMEFSIEGIAAMDYNGPRRNVTGYYPVTAQVVSVQWRWAAAILGVIPVIQGLGCICVIVWAGEAIIKDTSCLSTARLLRPVVEKLGQKGCLLTGEEISRELGDMSVMYGWREPGVEDWDGGEKVRHVDILEEGEGLGVQGGMPEGRYDGMDDRREGVCVRRNRRRRLSI